MQDPIIVNSVFIYIKVTLCICLFCFALARNVEGTFRKLFLCTLLRMQSTRLTNCFVRITQNCAYIHTSYHELYKNLILLYFVITKLKFYLTVTKIKKELSYNPQNFVLLAFRTGTCNCDVIDICFRKLHLLKSASQVALVVKNLPANAGDTRGVGSIPGLGRSPGGRHDNPFQYSCLENPQRQRGLAGYSPWGHQELDS